MKTYSWYRLDTSLIYERVVAMIGSERLKKENIKKENIKICFTASSGGHLEEISRLDIIKSKYNVFLITEKNSFEELEFCDKNYYLPQINRKELLFIFKFIYIFCKSLKIFLSENPDVVISTGALSTVPICLISKIFRKKIIYIESFARCNKPSLTGKIMYKFADVFIVQWEEMLEFFPKAIYGGGIF